MVFVRRAVDWSRRQIQMTGVRLFSANCTCDIEAEPLAWYRPGGYHPIHLGDVLNARYRILHKVGWGAYSTVWAARDERSQRHVAIKVKVSKSLPTNREVDVLKKIQGADAGVMQLLDFFSIEGPNGSHDCIVAELLGPSIADYLEAQSLTRVPLSTAKSFARQVLIALSKLHKLNIGHGDLHTRNISLKSESWASMTTDRLERILGSPKMSPVRSDHHDQPLESGVPRYLVGPASAYIDPSQLNSYNIVLTDFGEAFQDGDRDKPSTLQTPLYLRAPEVIFEDEWDHGVDLWTAGCTIFELVTGQPPFDSVMTTREILIGQMIEEIGPLPERWSIKTKDMNIILDDEASSLQDWLEEVYLGDSERLTPHDMHEMKSLGDLLRRLMQYEPRDRQSAREAAENHWFSLEETLDFFFLVDRALKYNKSIHRNLFSVITLSPASAGNKVPATTLPDLLTSSIASCQSSKLLEAAQILHCSRRIF
ncbi:kinase-like protein [Myriangium duriaei CBS 260.36]|uniref:Kinase-like protein n=1 Tax=Myriangium duriaei CBS 260.36 TaxID=1168546 RepID=A0A9P4IZE5_9PEZI|nr:kinase-like protein [Myriangium duriaei CBS 260.36]